MSNRKTFSHFWDSIFLGTSLGQLRSRSIHPNSVLHTPQVVNVYDAAKKATRQSIKKSMAQEMANATRMQPASERKISPILGMFKEARDLEQRVQEVPAKQVALHETESLTASTKVDITARTGSREDFLRTKYYEGFKKGHYDHSYFQKAGNQKK